MQSVLISIRPQWCGQESISAETPIEWKPVLGYEFDYEVNNLGQIRTLKNSPKLKKFSILKPQTSRRNGYVYQMLYKDGEPKLCRVHRIVAQSFINNPSGYMQVNHKDGDKTNNNVLNLEWCSQSQNMKHAYRNKLQIPSQKQKEAVARANLRKCKPVEQFKNGVLISEYKGVSDASRKSGVPASCISRCCKNIRNSSGGYSWCYVEELDEPCKTKN